MSNEPRVALITGAGSGIGRAIALGLATIPNTTLCLVGRRSPALSQTRDLINAQSPDISVHTYEADVSVSSNVEDVVDSILRDCSQIDFLINNAGIFPPKKAAHLTSIADWDATLATNLRGPFLLIRAVLPGMLDRNFGRIINVSAPIKNLPQASAYCASKAALDSLTKSVAFELRGKNILVNAIEPPFCDTEMHVGGKLPDVVLPAIMELVNAPSDGPFGRIIKID